MRIHNDKVPIPIRRRAAQFLESLRGTPAGESLETATLADDVTPMYRPDLDGVAYYEFALERNDGSGDGGRRGFIVVSAGEHDFPTAHWSAGRTPVSDDLLGQAAKKSKKVARIYKVDSLAYVAEDESGEEVARSGEPPLLFTADGGEPHLIVESSQPSPNEPDERAGAKAKHQITRTGEPSSITIRRDITSWKQIRGEYAKTLAKPLAHLRGQARKAWELEALIDKFGEGLFAGEPHRVALLEPDAKVEASGDAASLTGIRRIDHRGGAGALELLASDVPPAGGGVLDLDIRYGSGLKERLEFFVVSRQGHSDMRGRLGAGM